jgi:hypothetical protein
VEVAEKVRTWHGVTAHDLAELNKGRVLAFYVSGSERAVSADREIDQG